MSNFFDNCAIIGSDPGPKNSALAAVAFEAGKPRLFWAAYLPNEELATPTISHVLEMYGAGGFPVYLAYEKCGAQFKSVGETVFETAAMGGEIRRAFRPYVRATYAFKPSEWRYLLCGQGNAKTPLIYSEICALFEPTGSGADPYKGTRDKPGPLWLLHEAGRGGFCEHLKDSIGAALSVTRAVFRTGESPDKFKRGW